MNPHQSPSKAVYELLIRYELGEFQPNVRKRLAAIFAENPPDVLDRLEVAADYLKVDGSGLELAATRLDALLDEGELVA